MADLRRNIYGLSLIVQTGLKLDPFERALFVFCNKQMNKLKILHFDEGFWLYYYRLEKDKFSRLCVTFKGARASATIYSVVETAKGNGLVVEKYLVYLMDVSSNLENKDKNTILKHMPWSKELPETVKLQNKNLHGKKD